MKNKRQTKPVEDRDGSPPVLSSWKQLYGIVFLNLVLLIVLFYLFTLYFR